MEINYIHELNITDKNIFRKEQEKLSKKLSLEHYLNYSSLNICAGVDVSYWEKNNKTFGACSVVLIDLKSKHLINKFYSVEEIQAPYEKGYLAMRELPIIIHTISKIPENLEPNIFMFDGNGILHGISMGIASHASFFINKPTIGISKSCYYEKNVKYTEPKNKKFEHTNIYIDNEIRGVSFRSHKNIKPIFISPGNLINLDSSIEIVKKLIEPGSKLPIPTRLADIETHKIRNKYN